MNLTNWNPFREMDEFFNDYRGWFGRNLPQSGLPENVDEKNIRAESKDGVLKIHLPKAAENKAEPRKIAVK